MSVFNLASRENPTYWDEFDWDETHFDGTLAGATGDVSLVATHAAELAAAVANATADVALRAAHKAVLAAVSGDAASVVALSAYHALQLGASGADATSQIVLRPAHKATLDTLAGDALADLALRIRDEYALAATTEGATARLDVVIGRVRVFVNGQAEDAAAALVGQIALKTALDSVLVDAVSQVALVSKHAAALAANAANAEADFRAAVYVALRMDAGGSSLYVEEGYVDPNYVFVLGSDAFAQLVAQAAMQYRVGAQLICTSDVRVRTTPPRFPITGVPTVGMSGAFLLNTPARQGSALPVTAL